MHGPTFMANPLACALAIANLKILASNKWKNEVLQLEQTMNLYFPEFKSFKEVKDVRVLGAIGVIELHKAVDMKVLQAIFVNHGIWLRPFGKLVYTMPPYIMSTEQMKELIQKTKSTLNQYFNN
jgi:adenosylmethionine-8-amino-7-oxononanoate aminotransferase